MSVCKKRLRKTRALTAMLVANGIGLTGCATFASVKPNVVITPNSERTAATLEVIAGVRKSETFLKDLALQTAPSVQSILQCPSGQATRTWLNDGKPQVLEDRPEAHSVTLQFRCVE
ncbi:MAG: hypothetical protein AAGH76_08910 [Pseudomonadota bacterium]